MYASQTFGRSVRLRRLYQHGDDRLLVVPLDHSLTDGPIVPSGGVGPLVGQLARNGVDAVVLHKGAVRMLDHTDFTTTSLIVHLSASTAHAPDPDAKYLVSSVEEALRLGADAVSVHVNLGSDQERRQITDLASVSDACDRWSLPLLAMMYPRGPRVDNPRDPGLVAHAATLAVPSRNGSVGTVRTWSHTASTTRIWPRRWWPRSLPAGDGQCRSRATSR